MALFAYLLRKGAAMQGVLIGAVAALIMNILLFAWTVWALFAVVCLLLYLILSAVMKGS